MKLYHYSEMKLTEVSTRLHRGDVTPKEKAEGAKPLSLENLPYTRHVSFFLTPVPLARVAKIFQGKHPFWKPKAELYCHEINADNLFPCWYRLVESREASDLYYNPKYDHLSVDEFIRYRRIMEIEHDYIGNNHKTMLHILEKAKLTVPEAYDKLAERLNEHNKTKYAATIPHLMAYPEKGVVKVDRVTKMTIPDISKEIYQRW